MASRGFGGAVMQAFGARNHLTTVTEVVPLTDHCVRIRFHSPTLFDEALTGPATWVRGWFPDGHGKEFQRAYTFSESDAQAGTFALDFVLHEPSGPAAAWARTAAPGAELSVISMSSVPFEIPANDPPAGYLLIADSASLSAINTIIAAIPDTIPIALYLEQHDELDRALPLETHPRLETHWVPRRGAGSLAAALAARDWSNWFAWAGAESSTLKEIRKRLKEFGFPRSEIHAQAYWVQGKAMGKERAPDAESTTTGDTASDDTAADDTAAHDTAADDTAAHDTAADDTAAHDTAGRNTVADALTGHTSATDDTAAPVATADHGEAPVLDDPQVAPPTPTSTAPIRGQWTAAGAGRLLAPLKRTLQIAGIAQALVTLVQLAPYVVLAELGRRLLRGDAASELWDLGFLALGLMAAGALLDTALLGWLHLVDSRFSLHLRQRLLAKLARVPLGWFTTRSSGSVKSLVQEGTLSLHYLVTHAVLDAAAAIVAPIAVLIYLFIVDWAIALVLFIPVLVYVVTMWRMVVVSGSRIKLAQSWIDRMNGEAAAYLSAQPVVRVFGGAVASRFRRDLDEYIDFLVGWQRPFVRAKTVMDLATRPATFLWLIAATGTCLVVADWTEPPDLLPFLLLGTTFGARLLGIGYGLAGLRGGLTAARDIQAVLDERELELSDEPAGPGTAAAGRVEYRDVSFGYNPNDPVIHHVDLTLQPGTVTALVGPSGSGKSTLAALVARFHDVDSGAITIAGTDLRHLSADELYTHVGFVFQDPQLVHGTVAENIALAVPDASAETIENAARAAHIHDRITQLPAGYDTVLGADTALSGGERQRLTIARMLVADTPIVILDEATAFSDPESEYLVQQSLSRLAQGRTVLVIAHRLHTIVDVDHIVVLNHGRITESGTHTTLLERGGEYRALWDARATTLAGEGHL